MNSSMKSLDRVWQAGRVDRYHTTPTIGSQNVGDHSYGVAVCLLWLTSGNASGSLLTAAIYHDVPELWTGDVPAQTKRSCKDISCALKSMEEDRIEFHGLSVGLTEEEELLLKAADRMELILYAKQQVLMGNRFSARVFKKGMEYFRESLSNSFGDELIMENLSRFYNEMRIFETSFTHLGVGGTAYDS